MKEIEFSLQDKESGNRVIFRFPENDLASLRKLHFHVNCALVTLLEAMLVDPPLSELQTLLKQEIKYFKKQQSE